MVATPLVLLAAGLATAPSHVYRVADWQQPAALSSFPAFIARSDGTLIGSAFDRADGVELWVSDGTQGGTRLVRDILPGPESSSPSGFVELGGTVYFIGADRQRRQGVTMRYQLWRTDGTPAGTWKIRDFAMSAQQQTVLAPVIVRGALLFAANAGDGWALWRSDGTPEGTVPILGGLSNPSEKLTVYAGRAYFATSDSATSSLWASDGTTGGTVRVREWPTWVAPGGLVVSGRYLFFSADDPSSGQELWRTDGTADGTVLVKDLAPGPANSSPTSLTDAAGTLFFATYNEPRGLWRSDGSADGTLLLRNDIQLPTPSPGSGIEPAAVGQTLFFVASDSAHGGELWASDGTQAGTRLVRDIWPGIGFSSPGNLHAHDGRLFFTANPGDGRELWASDGTEQGTVEIDDVCPGPCSSNPGSFVSVSDLLYFSADDGQHGAELWVTDGTTAGTRPAANLAADVTWVDLGETVGLGDLLLFGGRGGLSRSDGTAAGTFEFSDVPAEQLTPVGGTVFFRGYDPTHGYEPWGSDGTADGTRLVKDIADGAASSSPDRITAVGDYAYFRAYRWTTSSLDIWRSDGTDAGTQPVTSGAYPLNLAGLMSWLFFTDYYSGDLWRTDGTGLGSVRVRSFRQGGSAAHTGNMHALGGLLLLTADDGQTGLELWRSDGSEAGTVQVADICPGPCSAFVDPGYGNSPSGYFEAGTTLLYFLADDGSHGRELWRSDGTAVGTSMVADLTPGPDSSSIDLLGAIGDTVLFAFDDGFGMRLWASDGTATGTRKVLGGNAAVLPSAPWLVALGQIAYLAASDPEHGLELWVTDGVGMTLLADINPGPASSSPGEAAAAGVRLFFGADDGSTGRALWAVDAGRGVRKHLSRSP